MPGTERESAIQCVLFSLLMVLSSPGLLQHRELQPSPSLEGLPVCTPFFNVQQEGALGDLAWCTL